jgi:hypothetical protein
LYFYKGISEKVFSASPASNYDKLEPTMLEIIKSIIPKTQS